MNVTLRAIDENNRGACLALGVTEAQTDLVAPNTRSLDSAEANPRFVPLGVYVDGEMVGFVMYEPRGHAVFSVHRLMVDQHHQRRGIGHRAMGLVMERIAALGGETIYLSCRPSNVAAIGLFDKLGFCFHEEEADGELVYRFGPSREHGE